MKKALFVYSGCTGSWRQKQRIQKAIKRLAHVFEMEVKKTTSEEDLQLTARDSIGRYDVLIVAGGDGSFHRVANELAEKQGAPILGYINAGTMGDVGRNFGIGRNLRQSLKIIEQGDFLSCDLIKINSEYCVYMAASGAYADVAYSAKRKKKKAFGRFIYYFMSAERALKPTEIQYTLTINGQETAYSSPFILIMNGRFVGGFPVNGKGSVEDGLFEVYPTPKGHFNGLLWYSKARKGWEKMTDRVYFRSDEALEWCLDGEKMTIKEAEIKICPAGLKVFCKRKAKKGPQKRKK